MRDADYFRNLAMNGQSIVDYILEDIEEYIEEHIMLGHKTPQIQYILHDVERHKVLAVIISLRALGFSVVEKDRKKDNYELTISW